MRRPVVWTLRPRFIAPIPTLPIVTFLRLPAMVDIVRRLSSIALESSAFNRFVGLLERFDSRRPNLLRVLTYHRVDEPDARPDLYPGLISATPAVFEQQVAYLARHHHVVSLPDVYEHYRSGRPLSPRSVLITFDDAYRDFEQHAWPILRRYDLDATVFVATGFPGQPGRSFWWDLLHHAFSRTARREHLELSHAVLPLRTPEERSGSFRSLRQHLKTLPHVEAMALVEQCREMLKAPPSANPVLDWPALKKLADEGVTLAPHTRNHPLLSRLSVAEAVEESVASLHDLQQEIGDTLPVLAYPSGAYSPAVADALRSAGFALGFTTRRGINDLNHDDPLTLRRINVGRRTSEAVLRAQLLSWSVHLNRWQRSAG